MWCLADGYDKWYMYFWSANGWAFCVTRLHGPTVILFLDQLWISVYILQTQVVPLNTSLYWAIYVGCARVCVIMFWFKYSLIYSLFFLLFHVGAVNTIIWGILFCLIFWLANCSSTRPHHPERSDSKDRRPIQCQFTERQLVSLPVG